MFIGRFFGPLRAAVPLVAGIFEMPYWRFQFANFTSAFVWAAMLLRWRKWWKVALTGFLGTHLLVCATFMAASFSTYADEISSPLARWMVIGADHILVDNLWVSFVGPFLMWIVALVVFGCAGPAPSMDRRPDAAEKRMLLLSYFRGP